MRHLNPTLYEVIYDWFNQLPKDFEAKKAGNSRDNLRNSQEAIIACLIEQFPRSYREAYEVYRDFFSQIDIFSVYDDLDEINVLALATGSGGDVFGLIQACEVFFSGKRINIFSVEGNKDALRSQVNLFKQYIELNLIENDVNLIPVECVIESGFVKLNQKLKEKYARVYGFKKFDLIQSFKWMNEKSIRQQLRFYELYQLINDWLFPNRIAVLLEYANPSSTHSCDQTVSMRALTDFEVFCKQNWRQNQLVALTPTPCIARRLSQMKCLACQTCTGCYDEIESYVKLINQTSFTWQSSCVFVMKFATGGLAQQLVSLLQNDSIGYQTATQIGSQSPRFCTLNPMNAPTSQANAFLVKSSQ